MTNSNTGDGDSIGPTDDNTRRDLSTPIIPDGFEPPLELITDNTVLRPLGPEHNAADLRAWMSSVAHIKATPGFGPPHSWPPEEGMSAEANRADLEMHRRHFNDRVGFTYTVLDPADLELVLGCVYMYARSDETPSDGKPADNKRSDNNEVEVRSWVVADRPELDREIWLAVSRWLETDWPFQSVRYAPR